MPSSLKVRKKLLPHVPSERIKIYELGSGWGGLALQLAKNRPHAQVVAYEISPVPWLISYLRKCVARQKNLQIFRRNFFSASLEDADVVVCYLYPGGMRKLKPKLEKELKKGSLVISNSFAVPGWTLGQMIPVQDLWNSQILIYTIWE